MILSLDFWLGDHRSRQRFHGQEGPRRAAQAPEGTESGSLVFLDQLDELLGKIWRLVQSLAVDLCKSI